MFLFEEVFFELDNVIFLKMLKNWVNKIEKLIDV